MKHLSPAFSSNIRISSESISVRDFENSKQALLVVIPNLSLAKKIETAKSAFIDYNCNSLKKKYTEIR